LESIKSIKSSFILIKNPDLLIPKIKESQAEANEELRITTLKTMMFVRCGVAFK